MSITITNYIVFQLSNYDYNYNYFKKVINCNWLQLQITTTTSLLGTPVHFPAKWYLYIMLDEQLNIRLSLRL